MRLYWGSVGGWVGSGFEAIGGRWYGLFLRRRSGLVLRSNVSWVCASSSVPSSTARASSVCVTGAALLQGLRARSVWRYLRGDGLGYGLGDWSNVIVKEVVGFAGLGELVLRVRVLRFISSINVQGNGGVSELDACEWSSIHLKWPIEKLPCRLLVARNLQGAFASAVLGHALLVGRFIPLWSLGRRLGSCHMLGRGRSRIQGYSSARGTVRKIEPRVTMSSFARFEAEYFGYSIC